MADESRRHGRSRSRSPETFPVEVKLLSGQSLATMQVQKSEPWQRLRQRIEALDACGDHWALMFGDRDLEATAATTTAGSLGLRQNSVLTLLRLSRRKLCTASEDGTARIFELSSGKSLCILGGHCSGVVSVTFSEDGAKALTMTSARSIAMYDAQSGAQLWRVLGPVQDACLAADGLRVLVMDSHSVVGLLDASTGRLLTNLVHHAYYVCTAVFSPDGKALLTSSVEGFARLFDVESGNCLVTFGRRPSEGKTPGMSAASFSPDASKVLVSLYDGSADLYERSSGERICSCVGHRKSLRCATMSPDGKLILTASKDCTSKLFCASTGRCLSTYESPAALCRASFGPSEQVLTAAQDGTARLYDAGGKCIQSFKDHSAPVLSATMSWDGKLVLTWSSDLDAKLFDAKTGECLRSFSEEDGFVTCAQWAPGARQLLLAFFSGRVAVFDPEKKCFIQDFVGHTDCVHSMKLM
ncbi:unnamed protein product [Effrenium voratum]|nr:unnamed protein product [Effrenium voratum]